MSTHLPKSEIISLQESLRYFMTSDQAVLFLLNEAPDAATQFIQKCATEAKLLADCFYCKADSSFDTETLSQQLQQLGLNISLPNFSSGAQLEFCLAQVQQLQAPSVLIIDQADRLPPMTLASLYQLATDQTKMPLPLHVLFVGTPGLEKICSNFTQPRLKNPTAVLYFDPNDEALEDPIEDLREAVAPRSFWSKHKVKLISILVLIAVLFGFRRILDHMNQSIGGIGEQPTPSLPIPAAPNPSAPLATKIPIAKPAPVKKITPTTTEKTPALKTVSVEKTSTDLAPSITADLETQPATTNTNTTPIAWPGEKIPAATPAAPTPPAIKKEKNVAKPIAEPTAAAVTPASTEITNAPTAASTTMYTIQWIASPRQDTVTRFQTQYGLEKETFLASKTAGGKTWYFLLEGKFKSPHEAANTAATLKARIPNASPWVRKWSFDQP